MELRICDEVKIRRKHGVQLQRSALSPLLANYSVGISSPSCVWIAMQAMVLAVAIESRIRL